MGLNCQKGTITQPGVIGSQTISLPANFDPKIVILWKSWRSAAGLAAGDGHFTMGMGTKNGGAIQQYYCHGFALGAASTAEQTVHSQGTDAILKGVNSNATTVDFEVDLTDIVTGASSSFVLNWVDLSGLASELINYIVLGGDAISAARVGTFATTASSTGENVTVAAGFGQPDGLLFMTLPWTDATPSAADLALSLGAANSDTDRRCSHIHYEDGSALMALASWQKARALVTTGAGITADGEMDLAAKGSWPTDGFATAWPDPPGFAYISIGYLAWKGTMKAAIGAASAPTSTGSQTLSGISGSTAKGALFWSTMVASNASIVTAATGLGGFMVGASDGTNHGAAAMSELSGDAVSQTGRAFDNTKCMYHMISVTGSASPTAKANCTMALSGKDVVLTWGTVDAAVSREFNYVIFGEAAAVVAPRKNQKIYSDAGHRASHW
jgi:hypothetical protein